MDRVLASAPTRAELAREIHASYEAQLLQPDELTHLIYAEATGVSVRVAERILKDEVEAGRMTRREAIGNRRTVWAYARCTESPPDKIWDQIDQDEMRPADEEGDVIW